MQSKGGDGGPPTLTDEEESGSTTSSCDESGVNPPPTHVGSHAEKNKDDYDSSATVSAEEGGPVESEKSHNEDVKPFPATSEAPLPLTTRPSHTATVHIQAAQQSPGHGYPMLRRSPAGTIGIPQNMTSMGGTTVIGMHRGPSPMNQMSHSSASHQRIPSPHINQAVLSGQYGVLRHHGVAPGGAHQQNISSMLLDK